MDFNITDENILTVLNLVAAIAIGYNAEFTAKGLSLAVYRICILSILWRIASKIIAM